ncbi:helix-turn-helix domain-containing protein [Mucilaginibacter sp. CSA2-8R]|uniref:helix-turn-helix domain-containing protein n=1 Tax=Mucilaginibacter sp. CSA2-8R TaxID=3141542 RepID=UPI00315CC137
MPDTDIPLHVLPELPFLASDEQTAFGEHSADHRIDFFAVIWFTQDDGEHYIDFEAYPICKNTVYLLSKNQVHAIPSQQLPRAKVMVFSTDFFHRVEEPFLRQLFLPFDNVGITIPGHMQVPLEKLFDLILLENQGQADINLLLKYTTAFLWHLYRFSAQRFSLEAGEDHRMVKLFQLMEVHYKEGRSASYYAAQIGLTAKRINEILRQRTGFTISQLLYQFLVIEAKREIYHNRLSIKEIAYQLGFSDQSYFARFFKKHTGLTPEQFRESQHSAYKT